MPFISEWTGGAESRTWVQLPNNDSSPSGCFPKQKGLMKPMAKPQDADELLILETAQKIFAQYSEWVTRENRTWNLDSSVGSLSELIKGLQYRATDMQWNSACPFPEFACCLIRASHKQKESFSPDACCYAFNMPFSDPEQWLKEAVTACSSFQQSSTALS